VRILVDQSGYDLLNIGDVAMLQSCVVRLQQQWPNSEVMVITHSPDRLSRYCPDATAIGPALTRIPLFRFLPRKLRLASDQGWKMAVPYFSSRIHVGRRAPGRPRTAIQAVQAADLVVASGGAYLTDTWWWHAMGILSLLSLAQRLGKPTAMFGQGIGPLRQRALRLQAGSVLPGLAALSLREDRIGRDLALGLGIPPGVVTAAGDDSLELMSGTGVADGHALGANLRVSGYAGVAPALAAAVMDLVLEAAAQFAAPIVALPVSRYPSDADIAAIRALLSRKRGHTDIALDDLTAPEALASAAASCRAIVTGSYHAAVFGLAQGVPAVCLTKSGYYDAKFGGLLAQFPGACFVVSLDMPDYAARVRETILQAWHLPPPARADARARAKHLGEAGRAAYAQFRIAVEAA
jgi:polysaccharide pyruvyl transferase WcaK-like protein